MSVKFSICVVTYRNPENVRRCLDSIYSSAGAITETELILTDNGAGAEIATYFDEVASTHRNVKVVHNARNEGFINPTAHALTLAEGRYFILLNDDSAVPHDWLSLLEAPFLSDPRCALASPNGGCCAIDDKMNGHPSHQPPEYLEGACLMGRTKQLREFGLWAPELEFAYWEDVDLSLRFREAGWNLRFANFKLDHIRGATSKHIPDILAYQRKNAGYIHKRWGHYLKHRRFDYPTILRREAAHGDVLLLTPIIREMRRLRPCSPIWVETVCWEVVSNNPNVAKFFPKIQDAQIPKDAVVHDLNMAYEKRTMVHIVDAYADAVGLRDVPRVTEIYPTASDIAWAVRTLPGDDWVAIHAGPSTWKGKQWPVERFDDIAQWLQGMGQRVVLVGSVSRDMVSCDLDLRGHTTVLQMAAVMRFCKFAVCIDSLPFHCAQAMGTPTVCLYGATYPEFIATDGGVSVAVCGTTDCHGERHRIEGATSVPCEGKCMRSISVEMVKKGIVDLGSIVHPVALP